MPGLLAGYGETTITPPLGTDLTGFGFYLDRRSERAVDDLKVRALFIKDEAREIILISCDLLGLTVSLSDKIRLRVARDHKVPAENVLLACTHTHSGPAAQPLPGLGKINRGWLRGLPGAIGDAVAKARSNAAEADFGCHLEAVEPIGFNRRLKNFAEVDPWLKTGVFRQRERRIFLLSYACHAVTLGPTKEISADWPGALAREVEKRGDGAIVFQGFCGDIDPVCYLNRRLGATADDIALAGRILGERALKACRYIKFENAAGLNAGEMRIRLPLQVFRKRGLERQIRDAYEMTTEFPRAGRIIRTWLKKLEKEWPESRRHPWMRNVPVQVIRIGKLKILALPGEVFCDLAVKLRRKWPSLMTIGYANGNVGYLPTRKAFKTFNDYACYCAPKFYAVFPFSPETESLLLRAGDGLLSAI